MAEMCGGERNGAELSKEDGGAKDALDTRFF